MNIGRPFDYHNRITFISTYTKIGTPHEKTPVTVQMEVNVLIRLFLNAGSKFGQCLSPIVHKLSPIVHKLSPQDTTQNLGKAS